jgi:hypothetical protein
MLICNLFDSGTILGIWLDNEYLIQIIQYCNTKSSIPLLNISILNTSIYKTDVRNMFGDAIPENVTTNSKAIIMCH